MKTGDAYRHPHFGIGTVISITDDTVTVVFPEPPGMKETPGPHIVPVVTIEGEASNGSDD